MPMPGAMPGWLISLLSGTGSAGRRAIRLRDADIAADGVLADLVDDQFFGDLGTAQVEEDRLIHRPIFLDQAGLGIRDMALCRGEFLIIGGDYKDRFDSDAKPSRLFRWKGGEHDKPVDLGVDFGDLNPESIVVFGEGNDTRVLILSDDGEMRVDGRPNKERPEPQQFFRGVWLQLQSQ